MKKIALLFVLALLGSLATAQDLKVKKDKETKKVGFVDASDAWVIQPTYDDADAFKNGIAKVTVAKKVGLIDSKGAVLVAPTYDRIDAFKEGVAIVAQDKKEGLITEKGEVLLAPQYDNIAAFKNGLSVVALLKKEGLITNKGVVLIVPQYDNIGSFKNGVTEVKMGKLYGLIDSTGKEILKPQFDGINNFSGNYAKVNSQSNYGLVRIDGTVTIPAIYKELDVLGTTVLVQKTNWGMLKLDGSVIFDMEFIDKPVFNIKGTSAIVKKLKPNSAMVLKGIISKDGQIVLDFNFEGIDREATNWVVKTQDGIWYFMNEEYKKISEEYQDLTITGKLHFADAICGAKQGGKWGFINNTFQTVIPYQFDALQAGAFSNGYCGVKVGDLWGFIKKDGSWLQQPKFTSLESPMQKQKGMLVAMVTMGDKKYVFFENGNLVESVVAAPAGSATSNANGSAKTTSVATTPDSTTNIKAPSR